MMKNQNKIHICVISNITLEPFLFPLLHETFSDVTFSLKLTAIRLEEVFTKSIDIRGCDLIVVLPNLEAQCPNWYCAQTQSVVFKEQLIHNAETLYKYLKQHLTCPVLWFGYEGENNPVLNTCGSVMSSHNIVNDVNVRLSSMFDKGDVVLDTRHLIASVGLANAYNNKNKYRWNTPYSTLMMRAIANEIYMQYRILHGISKKCLIIDCDGVLWGGILAEDGIARIVLGNEGFGRTYQDFQRFLLSLYQRGVLLAICSKNDLQDVIDVFHNHSGMILREENIACFQVNWESKEKNIRRIADTLRIGLDSIVFVDDTEAEIATVQSLLPKVMSIYFRYENIYAALTCFCLPDMVDSILVEQRMETYRTDFKRNNLRINCVSDEEYKQELETHIEIHQAKLSEATRIAEISQRTNRCTNGMRYSVSEVIDNLSNPNYRLYSVCISDRFSDLGLVGVIGLNNSTLEIFALSCRAFGRGVEDDMLTYIKKQGVTKSVFLATGKNDGLLESLRNILNKPMENM